MAADDRPDVPMPDGWAHPTAPDDDTLRDHARWLAERGYEPRPDSCFWCWYLARREAQ